MLDDTINSAWVVGGCPGVPQTVIVCRLCQTMIVEYRHLSPRHLLQVSSTKRSICQYHSVWKWGIPIYTQMATLTDTNKIISPVDLEAHDFSDCYPVAWFLHAFFGSQVGLQCQARFTGWILQVQWCVIIFHTQIALSFRVAPIWDRINISHCQ